MFQKARTTRSNLTDAQLTETRLLEELASVAPPRDLEVEAPVPGGSLDGHPRFRPMRAGRYVITDPSGHPIGSAMGDYVIGFTVACWERKWRFPDLDYAKVVVSLEAEARHRATLRDAS